MLAGLVSACDKTETASASSEAKPTEQSQTSVALAFASSDSPTNVYFGDTHLHTSYSPDAFLMGNQSADPDTAYRYAKGLPVVHPYHKARIQIGTPLDFLVVSDHGEFMGVIPNILKGNPIVADTPTGKRYKKMFDEGKAIWVFGDLIS